MPDIYDQHKAAFARVSAYVVLKDGERVATIAFKFPADGAGRLYAYVHWLGVPMVRSFAGGYGYDKRTAACASAVEKLTYAFATINDGLGRERMDCDAFWEALHKDKGPTWDSALREAGFTVLQAV